MEYTRISKYYAGCDGTKLAVDLYRPACEDKVPVLFQCGYMDRRQNFEFNKASFERFIDAGYAIALVEPRGHGASYGVSEGFFSEKDAKDLAVLIDTIAAEDWCSGKAGMFGGSNMGHIQHLVLAQQPKRLFASAPCDCHVDLYYQNFTNGASALPRMRNHHSLDPNIGTPVDEDPAPDYPLAHEALDCHKMNLGFLEQHLPQMCRDTVNPKIGYAPNMVIPVWQHMKKVRHGHTAVYHNGAWFDPGCTSAMIALNDWGGKAVLGPWRHCEIYRGGSDYPNGKFDWVAEHLHFFDAELRGAANTSASEPPLYYYTIGAPEGEEWRYAADLPLDTQTMPELKFTALGGMSESEVEAGSVSYVTREDVSLFGGFGRLNRRIDTPMNENDAKCLCFDSDVLDGDLEITGVPVLDVYLSSTHTDCNIIAALEEVLPDGTSRYITDGAMRASHMKTQRGTPRDTLNIPYHPGLTADMTELRAGAPNLLSFNLEGTSYIAHKGSKLRIALAFGGCGFDQPEGFPEEAPTITVYTGGAAASLLRLPVIAPTVSRFVGELEGKTAAVYAFKRAVYIEREGRMWEKFPCLQVYPKGDEVIFVTEKFTAVRSTIGGSMQLTVEALGFKGEGKIPATVTLGEKSWERKENIPAFFRSRLVKPTFRNVWVASVPIPKEVPGQMNPQPFNTLDLFMNIMLPDGGADKSKRWPCVVNVHGFGGSPNTADPICNDFLARGIAVATVDYRLEPPSLWPASDDDTRGCIRCLKARADEFCLDPRRFAILGGSMGGQLAAMICAANGDPAIEGSIGGNTEQTSSVKVGAAYFAPTDYFGFGDDCAAVWPNQPEKVANCDSPYAPIASMTGYVGPGKGLGDIKAHLFDSDPKYRELIELVRDISPISHVTENSAPCAFVHGIFDCGIQVPMGQSIRMFEAYTRKGVKSLLLCNNLGVYGDDPEVRGAVAEFIASRI